MYSTHLLYYNIIVSNACDIDDVHYNMFLFLIVLMS